MTGINYKVGHLDSLYDINGMHYNAQLFRWKNVEM